MGTSPGVGSLSSAARPKIGATLASLLILPVPWPYTVPELRVYLMTPKVARCLSRLAHFRWVGVAAALFTLGGFAWYWHATAPLRAARAAVTNRAWYEGIKRAGEYLRDHPDDPEAMRIMALCLSAVGRVEQAEQLFTRVPNLSVAELEWRGQALVNARQWDRAAPVYEQILQKDPDNSAALQHLAAIWARGDRLAQALQLAARLARLPGHAASGHALQALIYHRRKEWAESVAHWQKVLELDPFAQTLPPGNSIAAIRFRLAEDLLRLGRTAEAREQWERIVRLQPQDAQDCEILGSAAERLGDFDAALHHWRRSLELQPDQYGLKIRIGQLEQELGRVTEALDTLLAAAKEGPATAALHQALAGAYAANGQRELSLQHRAKAEQLRPQEERERGMAHVLIARPESADAKLILAAEAYKVGDYVAAESRVREVMREYPDRQDARRMLELIHARQVLGP